MTRRIVFITATDPRHSEGGHASYVRAHTRAALRVGFTPHIFCAADGAEIVETDFGIVHRVRTDFFSPREPGIEGRKKLLFWDALFVSTAIERFLLHQPGRHLIHGISIWGCSGIAARERLRRQGIEAVVVNSLYTTTEHELRGKVRGAVSGYGYKDRLRYRAELFWAERILRRYERAVYTLPRLVLVNYESVRRLFFTQYGPGAEVRRIAYASETAFRREHEGEESLASLPALNALRPADAPLIVSVSRHDPRKGLDVLLRALAELRDRGIRFRACLVSGGHLLAAHRRLADQLRLSDQVMITGWVSDPYPYLQHADIFALPSLQEGSGSVALLEALQAGAAIVASDLDGIPEDVTDGESALLVEPGNSAALSDALRRVVTDTALREQLRRRASATFKAQFSAQALTTALRDIYAELGFTAAPEKSRTEDQAPKLS
jgi:glycosyltransferase involved in cell wall biosynthesis